MKAFFEFVTHDWYFAIPMFLMSLTGLTLVIWRLLLNYHAGVNMSAFLPAFQQRLEKEGVEGALQMYENWTRRYEDNGTPHTKHVTTNLLIEVDEAASTATCRSYFTVLQQTPILALQPIIAGRYHDRFEQVDGAWRFSHRHIISDLFGDLSQHLFRSVNA